MLNDKPLLAEIDRRLQQFFREQRDGSNSSPAARFELEGMLQAAVLIGSATERQLWQRLSNSFEAINGSALAPQFQNSWADGEFPALPVQGQRAPVYPTTKDNDQDMSE